MTCLVQRCLHRGTFKFCLLGMVFLLVSGAQAAIYYVDPTAGSDKGNGSALSPWKKLEKVAHDGKLSKLAGGDTVLLRSGHHGSVTISGKNGSPITIAAAPGQTPQLSCLEILNAAKWVVKGLTISPSFGANSSKGVLVGLGENTDDVILEDCFIYTVLDASKWGIKEWLARTTGIWVYQNCTHITVRNNYVLNMRMGVILESPKTLFEGNIIANFSGDGLRIKNAEITAQYNVIKCAYVSMPDGDPNHDDLIQTFAPGGKGGVQGATIRGNILLAREDPHQPWSNIMGCHGIGCFDGPNTDYVVERNVIMTRSYDGLIINAAHNCRVLDNVCYCVELDPNDSKRKPRIEVEPHDPKRKSGKELDGKEPMKANTIKNNYAYTFRFHSDLDIVENNNLVTKEIYEKRLKEQLDLINDKFGKIHPGAKLPRVGMQ